MQREESSDEEEVQIRRRTEKEIQDQEELEMQKFIDFMKKQGLVMVQQGQQSPGMMISVTQGQVQKTAKPKDNLRQGPEEKRKDKRGMDTDSVDNSSVITLYQNAVMPASTQGGKNEQKKK